MRFTPRKALYAALLLAVAARWAGGAFVARQIAAKNAAHAHRDGRDAYSGDARFLFPDSVDFHGAAENLLRRGEHVDAAHRQAWRTPLYSILLAQWMFLVRAPDVDWARRLNVLLDLLNVLLVHALARRFMRMTERGADGRAGPMRWMPPLAAGLYALDPWAAYFANLVLADTLGTTTTLLTVLAAAAWMDGAPARAGGGYARYVERALLTGGAAGLATLAKPSLSLLAAGIVAYGLAALWGGRRASRRRWAGSAPWVFVGWALVLAPWWARNARVFDAFVPFSTMGAFTLYESVGPGARGGANLGTVDMPRAWALKQQILREGQDVYGVLLRPDAPSLPFRTDSLAEFRRDLTRFALAAADPEAPSRPGVFRLFAADPARGVVRVFSGPDDPANDWSVSYPPGGGRPAWISEPGRLQDDFAPVYAFLERDADLHLRAALDRHLEPGVAARLGRALRDAPAKVGRLWNPVPNFADARRPWINAASAAHLIFLLGFALAGMWAARRYWRVAGLLWSPALYLTALHAVFLGSVRYRMPATAALAVLAAWGVVWSASAFLRRQRRRP